MPLFAAPFYLIYLDFNMKLIKSILKKFHSLWTSRPLSNTIDSHKWESKVEILNVLSYKGY